MTKKEYEKRFDLEHKKDYGPKCLKIPGSILGAIVVVSLLLLTCMEGKNIWEVWHAEMDGTGTCRPFSKEKNKRKR